MLKSVSASSTTRLREVHFFLRMIQAMSGSPRTSLSTEVTSAKGLFFVHLYGAYEHTIALAVQQVLEIINGMGHRVTEFKPTMLSIVLHNKCNSMTDVGPNKMREKRWDLFQQLSSSVVVDSINTTALPTGSGNLKHQQLQTIWTSLCVTSPTVPRPSFIGTLGELVENRNALAHGRESATVVGRRYTATDLQAKYDDISELCTYAIQSLEAYLDNKDFLT